MTKEGLQYINTCLDTLNINYCYGDYRSTPIPSTYWVGECTETDCNGESGLTESIFMLTGTTNGKIIDLETVRNSIKTLFPPYGKNTILSNGAGIFIAYNDSPYLPSVDEGVHRIQINLDVKEWVAYE